MFSPLEQFAIIPIIRIFNNYVDFTISNSTIFMFISIFMILSIFHFSNTPGSNGSFTLIGNYWFFSLSILYSIVEKEIKNLLGPKGFQYISFLLSLWLFIFFNNVIGLIPYSFTTTSHFVVSVFFSLSLFFGYTIIGFLRHGLHYFSFFSPSGVPFAILPFIIFIEIVSYVSRIISLSVRLSANLIAGHAILKIIAGFGLKLSTIFLFIPVLALALLFGLETMVAVIQSYVFVLLTASYIRDAEYLH